MFFNEKRIVSRSHNENTPHFIIFLSIGVFVRSNNNFAELSEKFFLDGNCWVHIWLFSRQKAVHSRLGADPHLSSRLLTEREDDSRESYDQSRVQRHLPSDGENGEHTSDMAICAVPWPPRTSCCLGRCRKSEGSIIARCPNCRHDQPSWRCCRHIWPRRRLQRELRA